MDLFDQYWNSNNTDYQVNKQEQCVKKKKEGRLTSYLGSARVFNAAASKQMGQRL